MSDLHISKMSARRYYGPLRVGSVLLVNNVVLFHGSPQDVQKLYKRAMQRRTQKTNT